MSTDKIETYSLILAGDAAYTPPRIVIWFLAYCSIHRQPEPADSAVQDMIGEITSREA